MHFFFFFFPSLKFGHGVVLLLVVCLLSNLFGVIVCLVCGFLWFVEPISLNLSGLPAERKAKKEIENRKVRLKGDEKPEKRKREENKEKKEKE